LANLDRTVLGVPDKSSSSARRGKGVVALVLHGKGCDVGWFVSVSLMLLLVAEENWRRRRKEGMVLSRGEDEDARWIPC
jgi:hypothetical protein